MPKIIVKAPETSRRNKEQKMEEVLTVAKKLSKIWEVDPGKTDIIPGFFPVARGGELLLDCDIEIFAWDLLGREESKEEIKTLFKQELPWCHEVYIILQPPGLYKEC